MHRDVTNLPLPVKAGLGSGQSFWQTKAAAGLPAATLTDGPHGVRLQQNLTDRQGFAESVPATCFPTAAALAQTWDPVLVERVAGAIGAEARALGVDVVLGPAINIKRDPRCGRNFEYFSEDPLHSGALGAAWVLGLQSRGVGASVKHFAANNTESDRMRSDSRVESRALREIYLRGFQRVVEEARPWTVMCAYNKINGVYASENRWLLTDVLRGEWGFDGAVVSDWGAVADRVAALAAGLDLAMPGGNRAQDEDVAAAVESGRLDPAIVDESVTRVLGLLSRAAERSGPAAEVDLDAHHELAREAAARAVALLKNDGVLPLSPDARLAVIGDVAAHPRYQGGGSSRVNAARLDIPVDEIRRRSGAEVAYAPGYGAGSLIDDAVTAAATADVAVVFLGLPEGDDAEGGDRTHLDLPADQRDVLRAVTEVQPRTVAVVCHGGVVRLAEVDRLAAAVVDGALPGQGGGAAIADVLFGAVNPSGRLAETVPVRLEDAPSFLNFPGEHSRVLYGEGLFVGYRGYDARAAEVTYPFGHGLSYTTFRYSDLRAGLDGEAVVVEVAVTNTGPRDGREVVQLYASKSDSAVLRAPRELRGFTVLDVPQGQTRPAVLRVPRADFAYWDDRVGDWVVEGGPYTLHVGASSRDIRARTVIQLDGDAVAAPVTGSSTIGEALSHPVVGPRLLAVFAQYLPSGAGEGSGAGDLLRMIGSIPLDRLGQFGVELDPDALDALLGSDG
ncbi:glycoside hydrolase family 3 C-terminal domain-containing protein [Mycolicibacterium vaccae]|uniref:glycoside hydrolase family 3 C-terminal domain-containing protein n=1 Tax=Mycolicibacterium vaccae TaxID=1810 RepID=UPI003D086D49